MSTDRMIRLAVFRAWRSRSEGRLALLGTLWLLVAPPLALAQESELIQRSGYATTLGSPTALAARLDRILAEHEPESLDMAAQAELKAILQAAAQDIGM